MTARVVEPLQRVACPCNWVGNRRNPTVRDCPACGGPGEKIETLWQVGQGPHQSIIYLLHFNWPYGRVDPWHIRLADGSIVKFHADHYSGKTRDLPRRLSQHLSGVFVPGQRGHRGHGARLVAAAIAYGAEIRLARIWHVPLAFEQRLRPSKPSASPKSENGHRYGAWTSLRPYCPDPSCSGERAWGRLNEAKVKAYYRAQRRAVAAERLARREWDAHCAQLQADGVWDADREWNETFPHLAYCAVTAAEV
jgi:hypothetical protein